MMNNNSTTEEELKDNTAEVLPSAQLPLQPDENPLEGSLRHPQKWPDARPMIQPSQPNQYQIRQAKRNQQRKQRKENHYQPLEFIEPSSSQQKENPSLDGQLIQVDDDIKKVLQVNQELNMLYNPHESTQHMNLQSSHEGSQDVDDMYYTKATPSPTNGLVQGLNHYHNQEENKFHFSQRQVDDMAITRSYVNNQPTPANYDPNIPSPLSNHQNLAGEEGIFFGSEVKYQKSNQFTQGKMRQMYSNYNHNFKLQNDKGYDPKEQSTLNLQTREDNLGTNSNYNITNDEETQIHLLSQQQKGQSKFVSQGLSPINPEKVFQNQERQNMNYEFREPIDSADRLIQKPSLKGEALLFSDYQGASDLHNRKGLTGGGQPFVSDNQVQRYEESQFLKRDMYIPSPDLGNKATDVKAHNLNTMSIQSNSTFEKVEEGPIKDMKRMPYQMPNPHPQQILQFKQRDQRSGGNQINEEQQSDKSDDPYKIFNNSINFNKQKQRNEEATTQLDMQGPMEEGSEGRKQTNGNKLTTKVTSSTNLNHQGTFNLQTPQYRERPNSKKGNKVAAIDQIIATAQVDSKFDNSLKTPDMNGKGLNEIFRTDDGNGGMPELRLRFKNQDDVMAYSQTDRLGIYSRRVDREKDSPNSKLNNQNQVKRNSYSNGNGQAKRGKSKPNNSIFSRNLQSSGLRTKEHVLSANDSSSISPPMENEDDEDQHRVATDSNLINTSRKLIDKFQIQDDLKETMLKMQEGLKAMSADEIASQSYPLNVFGVLTVDENGEFYTHKTLNSRRRRNAKFLKKEVIIQAINKSKRKCQDRLIISQDSRYKYIFSLLMMLLTIYSTFTATYYAAFGMQKDLTTYFINYGIEVFFFLDIVQNFLYEYTSEEDFIAVRDFRKISVRYLRSGFILDLVSFIPFGLLARYGSETQQLLFLVKMVRILKLFQLVHLRNFWNILKFFYNKKFNAILKNANLRHDMKRDNNEIMKQIVIKYVIRVIRLIAILFILSYFIGTVWYIVVWKMYNSDPERESYFKVYGLDVMKAEDNDIDSMIIVVYWAFTTLSSLGYGDYYPRNNDERIVAVIVFLFGVALFTFIMNDLMEILMQYQRVSQENNETEALTKWFGILAKYNKGVSLPNTMISKFENFFEYYWHRDRNFAMKQPADQRYLQELPKKIRIEIYKDFLFRDFLYLFKSYFFIKKDSPLKLSRSNSRNSSPGQKREIAIDNWDAVSSKGKSQERRTEPSSPEIRRQQATSLANVYTWRDDDYSALMLSIMHHLQPRKFEKNEVIYEEGEEVLEIIFVCSGAYGVGFMIQDRDHISVRLGKRTAIGDYNMVSQTYYSEFKYRCLSNSMDCYVLKNFQITRIMEKHAEMCTRLKRNILKFYETQVRGPVLQNKAVLYKRLQNVQPELAKTALLEIDQKNEILQENIRLLRSYTKNLEIPKLFSSGSSPTSKSNESKIPSALGGNLGNHNFGSALGHSTFAKLSPRFLQAPNLEQIDEAESPEMRPEGGPDIYFAGMGSGAVGSTLDKVDQPSSVAQKKSPRSPDSEIESVMSESIVGQSKENLSPPKLGDHEEVECIEEKTFESEAEELLDQIGDEDEQKRKQREEEERRKQRRALMLERRMTRMRSGAIKLTLLETRNSKMLPPRRQSTQKSAKSPAFPSKRGGGATTKADYKRMQSTTTPKTVKFKQEQMTKTDMEQMMNQIDDLEERFETLGNAFQQVFEKYDEVLRTVAANN